MSIAKLKQLFKQEQWQDCAALARQMLSKNEADKGALLMLAQSQIKLNELGQAQQTLNQMYALLNNSSDDTLFYAYLTQEKLALRMCDDPGKNSRKQGRQILLKNKFQLIDWLDKMKRFELMLKEAENYCVLLLEEENYKMIEDTYLWLLNHEALQPEVRAAYGARIFEIDQFYNPYSRLDNLFPRLVRMKPPAQTLTAIATKMLDYLEKQNSKKSLASVFSGNVDSNLQSYREFSEQIMLAGQFAFTTTEAIFKNKSSVRMFARYLGCAASTTLFGSDEWLQFEARIETLLKTQYCTSTFGDIEQNPLQLYLLSFVEVSKFLGEARIPNFSELRVASLPVTTLVEGLEALSSDYQEFSFYVNAYYSMVAVSEGNPIRMDPVSVQQKMSQAGFLHRKALFYKLAGNKERSSPDLQVYLNCALLKLQLPREQFIQNLAQADVTFEKNKNHLSKAICEMHQAATADLRWQQSFSEGKWLEAIEILDQLAQRPEKANYASVMKAKIQIYHLKQICTDDERDAFLQGIMNCLQSCDQIDAENLLLQGYLLWTFPKLFVSDPKQALQKWLLALKKDQTNCEIYFSLAVYYFSVEDGKRAIGCLEKARKLQPDFEDALVLQYYLMQGQSERLHLIDQFLLVNKNLAVTYFLKGLIMQETQDYFQAIESYQNALKFYNIQQSKPVTTQRLLPKADLPIYQNPFGIYGEAGAANCWVYQSECFMKIDKPQVALKCFIQGAEKIASLKLQNEAGNSCEVEQLLSILDIGRLRATEEQKIEEPLLVTIETLQPNKWALECLLLGSQLVSNPITSISILRVALSCQPNQGMLAFTVTQLLSAMTQLVEQNVVYEHGKVQLLPDADKLIERLDMVLQFVSSRPELMQYQNLQRRRLNAEFIMAQRLQDKERHRQVMLTASSLYERSDLTVWSSLILDYAKIIHEYERYEEGDSELQTKKIRLIRQAILRDPNNAGLWVHLHIFSKDEATRGKAIFQAYALDPQDNFVQENILKFYLSTKQWQKAFSIIVRSYQRAADQNEPQLPIILATLAYFNAMCYFQFGQKEKLLEALSLIRLVQREDMKQLMSEIYIYLSYYKGDYAVALDFLKSRPQNDQVDLMMLKALFGTQDLSFEELLVRSEQLQTAKRMLSQVVGVDSLSDDELKQKCQQHLNAFCKNPVHEAPFLQLYQELCLKRNVLVESNLLDVPEIKQALQTVTHREQRTLLVQSLRLLQKRDGFVKEVQAIADQPNQQIPESEQSYTQFLIETGRLKPQSLSLAQHKALLRLYLESRADPDLLEGPFKDSSKNVSFVAKIQGLKIVLRQKSEAASQGASLLQQAPLSIHANTNHLWSLLRDGRLGEAKSALAELKQKIQDGEIQGTASPQLPQIEALLSGALDQLPLRLKLISQLLSGLSGREEPREQALLSKVACHLVNIVQRTKESQQQEMVQLIFKVMGTALFQQGHYTTYMNLAKDILSFTTVLQTSEATQNLIWHNQLLAVGSALLQARKTMQALPLCKEIETVARKGSVRRDTVAASLLRARTQLALKNYSTAQQALNIDESSLERDIFQALVHYANQDYKEFYLVCLGLVAGAKTSSSVDAWLLAYVYYLKALAEMTFLQAKRQGIKLKDDFNSEDSQTYDSDFFTLKARTSLEKCLANLDRVAEDGWLSEAARELQTHI